MRFLIIISLFSYAQAYIQIGRGVRPEDLLVKLLNEVSARTKTTVGDMTTTEEPLTTETLVVSTEGATTTTEQTTEVEISTTTTSEETSTVKFEAKTETPTEAETTTDDVTTTELTENSTVEKRITDSSTTTTTSTATTTTATPPELSTTESGKCQDQFSRCHGVQYLCENTLYRKIMTTVCAKTCGFCHQFVRLPMPERCIDHNPKECQIWGDNGFCHAYFYTMPEKVENCMKTCGLC